MKKQLKRLVAVCMVIVSVCGLVACGGDKKTGKGGTVNTDPVTFPLEEEVTFTFMIPRTETPNFREQLANNTLWQELKKETNVNIEFMFLGQNYTEQIALLASSDKYGDVLYGGNILTSALAGKYIAAEYLIDLKPYINKTLMPNLSAKMEENERTIKMISGADGGVYTLPCYDGVEGTFLESPIMVNKAWLDKLGLSVPTTLDEFTNMLRAFKNGDPNGNGLADEIPYICSTENNYMHPEVLLGLWGLATKDAKLDSFVQVIDGKVTFVPTTDEYKEAVKYLNLLYEEGLMWGQCFTADAGTFNSKLTATTPIVGCFTAGDVPSTAYADDYICIAPPKVEGYDANWYVHYGIDGNKNFFFVTDKCEKVNVLMAWMDKFYEFDTSFRVKYGEPGEGRYVINGDGKYELLNISYDELGEIQRNKPSVYDLLGSILLGLTTSEYAEKVVLNKEEQIRQTSYETYQGSMNEETWPRPYLAEEDVYDAEEYTTDIMYHVESKRGAWITGKADVEKEWDAFKEKLDELGLQEWLEMQQKAYDAIK